MGAFSSKLRQRHRRKNSWGWSGPPGDHSPYPIDPIPYPGPDLRYCFVDIMASYNIIRNKINLGPQAVTTDVEDYMADLEDCYREGFLLNEFVKVPGLRTTVDIQDWGIKQPYQAILSKPTSVSSRDQDDEWVLKIEKKLLSTRTLAFDETDEDNDLIHTIMTYAASGARLVCVTPVGYLRPHTVNQQYGVIGVELFFNYPKSHHSPVRYTYHAVKVPANYHVVPDATQTIQQIQCDADFLGQMKLFLNQGWKLIDICMDTLALAEAFKMKTASHVVDTIWFFEKEVTKLHDHTPMYEGVIIEYLHKVQSSLDGESPCRDWRPVVAGMGVMGWELAAMIQTPSLIQSSFTKYTLKLLMIFQRRIDPTFEKVKAMRAASTLPHGKGFGKAHFLGGRVFGASGGTPGDHLTPQHNYSHTMKSNMYRTEPPAQMPNGHALMNGYATSVKDHPPTYWAAVNGNS